MKPKYVVPSCYIQLLKYLLLLAALTTCTEEKTILTPMPDVRPPAVEWVSVDGRTGSQIVVSDSVEIVLSTFDESGLDSIRIFKNGFTPDPWRIASRPAAPLDDTLYTFTWNTLPDSDGVYTLEARAYDQAGNVGTSPTLTIRVQNNPSSDDRIPPDVWFESPVPGAALRDTVRIVVGYFDESGVDSVQLVKDGEVMRTLAPSAVNRGGLTAVSQRGSVEFFWNTRADSDGVHLWQARAWDKAGNVGVSMSLLVRVKNNPDPPPADHTPPVVNWLSPQAGDTVQGRVELRFQVMDNVRLDSAVVYVNGAVLERQILNAAFFDGNVTWVTNSFADGNYIIEVRAWDSSGNLGIGLGVTLRVWNNRPRVIWVPDDYLTIQGAINASRDGDTVRIRAGTYREELRLMRKNIWLESEEGPEVTIIDASVGAFGLRVDGGQDTNTVIRGLTFTNANYDGISITNNSNPNIYNCIIRNSIRYNLAFWENSFCHVLNNIFDNSGSSNVNYHTAYGDFKNNIVINSGRTALWNFSLYNNPLLADYNLFWNYQSLTNEPPINIGNNSLINVNPEFNNESYQLSAQSPCIDSGDPLIKDLDGSRSDLGIYGGPFGYTMQ